MPSDQQTVPLALALCGACCGSDCRCWLFVGWSVLLRVVVLISLAAGSGAPAGVGFDVIGVVGVGVVGVVVAFVALVLLSLLLLSLLLLLELLVMLLVVLLFSVLLLLLFLPLLVVIHRSKQLREQLPTSNVLHISHTTCSDY